MSRPLDKERIALNAVDGPPFAATEAERRRAAAHGLDVQAFSPPRGDRLKGLDQVLGRFTRHLAQAARSCPLDLNLHAALSPIATGLSIGTNSDGAFTPLAETDDTVTLSRADYEAILDALDECGAHLAFARTREEESFPAAVADRLAAGENAVKVFRAYRKVTIRALAAASGLSAAYVSDIENGKLSGSVAALKAIAGALQVYLDDIA
jgi:DNA-binding XRE family transcriptional regulator